MARPLIGAGFVAPKQLASIWKTISISSADPGSAALQ
jgi:hypothetical protein